MAITETNRQMFAQLQTLLTSIGLGELFTVGDNGRPGGWLWNQIQQGIDTPEELVTAIESTDAFQRRYGIILEQRARAAKGEPVRVMTMQEVREYEQTVTSLMRSAGMPPFMYNDYRDLHRLIRNDLSAAEVEARIDQAWSTVVEAPQEVRREFSRFFGVARGDAALASFMLDPDTTLRQLDRMARTAYASGVGKNMGIDVGISRSRRIAASRYGLDAIDQGLQQVAGMSGVFTEGIGERTNLTAKAGIDATMFNDADAQRAIERRMARRESVNAGPTGGGILTDTSFGGGIA